MKLIVSKCTPNKAKTGYVLSLRTEGKKLEAFPGVFKETQGQLFLMSMKTAVPVGTTSDLDLDLFEIKEQSSQVADKNTGEAITITNKWLWLK
jgi:hypothetical protein